MKATCEKWHPGQPGEYYFRGRKSERTGRISQRRHCKICHRQRWQNRKDKYFYPGKPYGVLPALNWTPPEL